MEFHVYILRCNDGSYYVGHTEDLAIRMAQHAWGELGGYTAKRLPIVFLWSEGFPTRDDAFAAERKLKGWSRAKKEALMAGDWALVSELARCRSGVVTGSTGSAWPSTSSGAGVVGLGLPYVTAARS